jgi:hypothetical protein
MGAKGIRHIKLPGYKKIGAWGWDDHRLWSKIEVSLDVNECWPWTGSMSPSGALMGAWKDDIQQMTQARRLVYMSHTKEDVTPYQLKMKCKNQACCNPSHFELKANNKKAWNIFGEEDV